MCLVAPLRHALEELGGYDLSPDRVFALRVAVVGLIGATEGEKSAQLYKASLKQLTRSRSQH
jgi:hypothetical protein